MFKDHQDGEAVRTVVDGSSDEKQRVSVSATVKDKTLTVTMANTSLKTDEEIGLSLLGYSGAVRECEMTVLSAESVHDCNTFESPDRVIPVTV